MSAPEEVRPLVFERRLTRRVVADLVAGLAVGFALLAAEPRFARIAVELAASLPFSPGELLTQLVVKFACHAWLLGWVVAVAFGLPRRFGRAELWPDVIVFSSPLVRGRWGARAVPLSDVRDRRVTAHGVRVWSRGVDLLVDRLAPLVIPAADEAEAARICALLDPPALVVKPGATAGRAGPVWVLVAIFVWALGWLFTLPLGVHRAPSALLVAGALAALTACVLAFIEARRRWGRVHAGAVTLSILEHVVPWHRVRGCAIADGRLALEVDDGRRLSLHVGRGADADGLRAAVAAGLSAAGQSLDDALPAWAAVRRRRWALGAALLLPFAPYAYALTRREVVTRADHLGQTIHVLYRVWDGTADRVVLVIDDAVAHVATATLAAPGLDAAPIGAAAHVDLVAGRARLGDGSTIELPADATVLVIGPGPGQLAVSRRPLDRSPSLAEQALGLLPKMDPELAQFLALFSFAVAEDSAGALVEHVFPKTEDALLAAVREGRAARRCLEAKGPDGQLLVRLDRGAVSGCAIVEGKAPVQLGRCATCAWAPDDGQLLLRRASGDTARGRLPTLEQARAALQAVASGSTVERATRGWAPPP